MKHTLFFLIISSSVFGKTLNFKEFKVDTSSDDIKPKEREIAPIKPKLVFKEKEENYKVPINPFARPSSSFQILQSEQANQRARGINPN